mgnify:CR=1 FL=1
MHGGRVIGGAHSDSNLRVINAREVASAGRLVLLGLEREGVRVDTGVGGASVVLEGLDLVEVLALLLLEAVLAVKHKLEGVEGTDLILSEDGGATNLGTDTKHGGTISGEGHEGVGRSGLRHTSVKLDGGIGGRVGEVEHGVLGEGVGEAPHKLLNGVVVGEADLLGGARVNGVSAGVLALLDEVLVTLLGESATLLSVKVDVVSPDLEGGGVEPLIEVRGQVKIQPDLMILQSNQRQIESWVSVEKEV